MTSLIRACACAGVFASMVMKSPQPDSVPWPPVVLILTAMFTCGPAAAPDCSSSRKGGNISLNVA